MFLMFLAIGGAVTASGTVSAIGNLVIDMVDDRITDQQLSAMLQAVHETEVDYNNLDELKLAPWTMVKFGDQEPILVSQDERAELEKLAQERDWDRVCHLFALITRPGEQGRRARELNMA